MAGIAVGASQGAIHKNSGGVFSRGAMQKIARPGRKPQRRAIANVQAQALAAAQFFAAGRGVPTIVQNLQASGGAAIIAGASRAGRLV